MHPRSHRFTIGIDGLRYTRGLNRAIAWVIAGGVATTVVLYIAARRHRAWLRGAAVQRFVAFGLGLLVCASAFTYFYGSRGVVNRYYPKFWDTFHYFVGAKYFPETGYLDYYDCVAVADAEMESKIEDGFTIRQKGSYYWLWSHWSYDSLLFS